MLYSARRQRSLDVFIIYSDIRIEILDRSRSKFRVRYEDERI